MLQFVASPILVACVALTSADVREASPDSIAQSVRVSIAVPEHYGKRSIGKDGEFHVVITNEGAAPVALWREWCSWGYFNLTFEIVDESGAPVATINKHMRAWTKNYPDWMRIEEGDHAIRTVKLFDSETWDNAALFDENGEPHKTLRMRAVFSIPRDNETQEHNVWVGSCVSPIREYVVE